ncbi:hypothetical protein QJS04_geneDACA003778 [Acorus gramineus]|uniref:CAP-Gly domain-containing protein n=1 Tax=Acorus gramineus TaxID=55184 RepID=A0AAV9BIY4_ACOGR|nr:hypothetical protein QJS04_geneDACA003778 [Acorus gramineus]
MAAGAADGLLRCVFEGCLRIFDTEIERRPYHRNCGCALHGSRGRQPCRAAEKVSFGKARGSSSQASSAAVAQREREREMSSSRLQQIEGDESVLLRVTHSNLKTFSADVRFSLSMTVESVKEKLWKKCGTSVDSMRLELYDDARTKICDLDDSSRPFGYFSPLDGYKLHIIDLDPSSVTSGGWLEDTSLVEKYTISDEAYNKLDSNFRKFREKLATHNPTTENKLSDNYTEDLCANMKVGDRCEVEPGAKRGIVKFVGRVETIAPGYWVGIQYDEPLGKHDGLVKGKRYFNCPPNHGAMVRPDKVKVGDFPERDPFEEDEI